MLRMDGHIVICMLYLKIFEDIGGKAVGWYSLQSRWSKLKGDFVSTMGWDGSDKSQASSRFWITELLLEMSRSSFPRISRGARVPQLLTSPYGGSVALKL